MKKATIQSLLPWKWLKKLNSIMKITKYFLQKITWHQYSVLPDDEKVEKASMKEIHAEICLKKAKKQQQQQKKKNRRMQKKLI